MKTIRRLGSAFGTVAILAGAAVSAWGATAYTTFNTVGMTPGLNQRVPGDANSDFAPPASGNGVFSTDITNCPGYGESYNAAVILAVKRAPDQVVYVKNHSAYCDPAFVVRRLQLSQGRYHFDVEVASLTANHPGYGYLRLES